MNQATNLKQWKNLTKAEQSRFNFDNYKYDCQCSMDGRTDWIQHDLPIVPHCEDVYRLKIDPDEWYYIKFDGPGNLDKDSYIILGDNTLFNEPFIAILRPATPEEIPKPEPTLLERIEAAYEGKAVVLLEWGSDSLKIGNWGHYHAQSMKGFAGYVYEDEVQGKAIFGLSGHPVNCDRMGGFKGHPIAVLFEK